MPSLPANPGGVALSLMPVFLDALRAHRQITFALADDLGPHCGLTNLDDAVVFLSAANTDGEMLATIGHELHHLACQDCPDDEIEYMTAEVLVPLPDALAAITGDVARVAARLGVDTALVRARIRTLPEQRDGGDQRGVG